MIKNWFTFGILTVTLAISNFSFAQKKNETSAAVEYKNKFAPALASGDYEAAKRSLIAAKEFIDLAAEHPDTKESPKTLWLKGEIYSSFVQLATVTQDSSLMTMVGDDVLDKAIAAYKKGFEVSNKYDREIDQSVRQKRVMIDQAAAALYQQEMYAEAAEFYETEAKLMDAIGELDSNAVFNASLCYEKSGDYAKAAPGYEKLAKAGYRGAESYALAANAYRKSGNNAKSDAILQEGKAKYPTSKDILLELVQTKIDAGDNAGAEQALSEAIASDPNNKLLYYVIGTIYMDLGENGKAEESLNKALEIDPNYDDALYQLGAHLVTWGGNLRTEASQLKFGDPKYDQMIAESDAIYKRALIPLEKYIEKHPNDKQVLTILFQIHRSLGNSEKALEYKKRIDE